MASHENSEDPMKSFITDKVNTTAQSKIEEKMSLTTSSSVDQHNELIDTAPDTKEKKNSTSDITNDCASAQKKDSDDLKNKDNLKSSVNDENKQDDSKTDKKKEMQSVTSLTDPQNTDEKEEVKSENVLTKGKGVLKRKRKSNATTLEFPVEESKKKEMPSVTLLSDPQSTDEEKEVKTKDASMKGLALKRKRKSVSTVEPPAEENGTRSKRKKLKTGYDRFCWRCHKEKVDAFCTACPRSWHRKCIGGMPSSLEKWICGECATILKAENAETRSTAMAQLSIDQLCMLLKHVVERLRDYPGSEPFCKPVDLLEVPNYLDYVIKPMDLSLLESNVKSKLYGSTDAFMADAKWIQHNCIVFNTCGGVYTDTSKLTNAAKQIIKVARQEVSEIEACPDCYAHGRNLPRPQPSWFIEPCRRPHPLVWAKLKGFPFWPAKAMPRINSQGYVDVRFFGEHDRAWVPPKDLFLYSEEPPAPSPRKRKSDMDECVQEVNRHIRKLTLMFGQFKYALPKVQYDPNNPMQIQLILPNYNPLGPNHLSSPEFSIPQKKNPQKKRSFLKGKSQSDESTDITEIDTNLKGDAEKEDKATMPKVQKLDTDVKDTSNMQADLNGSPSKLNKKTDQGIIKLTPKEVAQNKTVKDYKPRNTRTSISQSNVADNSTENNSTSSNTSISDKNNSSKVKNEVKSSTKSLPKSTIQSGTESSDTTRAQRKSLLKNIINPKLALSQVDNSKTNTKYNCAKTNKMYKPKTRLVDKLNTEKELKSVTTSLENEKSSNSSKVIPEVLRKNKESSNVQKNLPEVDIRLSSIANSTHTIPPTNPAVSITDKSVLLLVVNGKSAESAQQIASTIDCQSNKDVLPVAKEVHQNSPRKARKSFPGKSSNSRNIQRTAHVSEANEVIQVSPVKHVTPSTYQLLPPEAGPISARLHHNAHDLARKMGHMMEEAYKEAAYKEDNGENDTADNYQATIFFLRMQIEHIKWQHQQQIAELKHNTDRTLREMRASFEAEKCRSVEEVRREVEEEKMRTIEETKRKQWCAMCGQEAMFYCCWNTAYCNYPCQQSHWSTHMRTCSQQPAHNTSVTNSGANLNPQQSSNVTRNSPSKAHSLSLNKVSGISSSSTLSLRNKTSKDTL
ncbi:protein kinase C-binding protein 1 isoform X2 [Monomorium pharaonis]|uniref:protein kinase C-binding protein 1 isoform X2 n=1 Tax=Monomorium pharaonis TaxID=307658 RepID=UPI00063F466E|nr:protein kinase C-binding protein 1 isoform X2 [Monomorium pharaonis]